eukprot:CAMPEP_0198303626 /NCGR_PEP_ID=MMETSP1449-20131203/56982_1 /TAXON_ID=420275 /ORGANISM="Attheya septentrionalis, Strain CCMP2084" /LENGTH=931 /DNA_ID=CAMNT_0044006123 /DNA_START=147 /DNA_END=2942 /DNA_ORIENTATION=+
MNNIYHRPKQSFYSTAKYLYFLVCFVIFLYFHHFSTKYLLLFEKSNRGRGVDYAEAPKNIINIGKGMIVSPLLDGSPIRREKRIFKQPSVQHPFFFFHIPKCGGSTLKNVLNQATKAIGKTSFNPCYDSIPCPTTENSILSDPALERRAACTDVFVGHFTTKLIPTLANIRHSEEDKQCKRDWDQDIFQGPHLPYADFECMVAMREPISRFVSHYYHFIEKDNPNWKGKRLSDCSIDDLTEIIHSSANNTMVTYLSNHMSATSLTWDDRIEEAENVLSHCIVVVLEDWNRSTRLVETAIPWIKGFLSGAQSKNVASNVSKHELIDDFSPENAEALKQMLEGDIKLYNKAIEIYRAQLNQYGIITESTTDISDRETGTFQTSKKIDKKSVAPSIATQFPTMVKSVTYYGRGNPLTTWDQKYESVIDADFEGFRKEGFNTVTLLVPWSGTQLNVMPPLYDSFTFERIEFVMNKAVKHGLRIIFRVSYPHSFNPANIIGVGERCTSIMAEDTSNGFKEGWLDYMNKLNILFSKTEYRETYLYSFFSWEDFFCLLSFAQDTPDNNERVRLSNHIGFGSYLTSRYSSDALKDMFPGVEPGEYPIPHWDIGVKSFSPYIDFIDLKWWSLVEEARIVHPNLSMEVRVDAEGGTKTYDMHLEDHGPPRQGYWSGYMGARTQVLSAEDGIKSLERILYHASGGNRSPLLLGQFNFQDNTPRVNRTLPFISLDECNTFLEKSATVLKKYTQGYGLWAYRDYRQSAIFNGQFLRGLEGWDGKIGGKGSITFEDYFVLLSANGINNKDHESFAKVEQRVRQIPINNCDNSNNNMEVCFKYRMKGTDASSSSRSRNVLYVEWDGTRVGRVQSTSSTWNEHCLRVPSLEDNNLYTVGFLAQGTASVNIDNVEVSCHTHSMFMHTVNNTRISTCFDGVLSLNKQLD